MSPASHQLVVIPEPFNRGLAFVHVTNSQLCITEAAQFNRFDNLHLDNVLDLYQNHGDQSKLVKRVSNTLMCAPMSI